MTSTPEFARVQARGGFLRPRELRQRVAAGELGLVPGRVAWAEHVKAWEDYARRYGRDQSALRIHERGGFSYAELTDLLGHEPETWEPV